VSLRLTAQRAAEPQGASSTLSHPGLTAQRGAEPREMSKLEAQLLGSKRSELAQTNAHA